MRISTRFLCGSAAIMATLALTACGGGTETATTDEDTAVTDVDPGEGDGTINDTTLIDGTIGTEEAMGMESRMPADSNTAAQSAAPATTEAEDEAEPEPEPEPEPASPPATETAPEEPAPDDSDGEDDAAAE